METKSRQEVFEEKLKTYNRVKARIEMLKEDNPSDAALLEGKFMVTEFEDLKEFLGDRIKSTKLFTIGENNMSRAEMQSEKKAIQRFIDTLSFKDNPEFDEEIYEMLYDECADIYETFSLEKEIEEERIRNFDLDYSKSKYDKEMIDYVNMRRESREEEEQGRKAWEKQQKDKGPELVDSSDKSKFKKHEIGRGEFGRG